MREYGKRNRHEETARDEEDESLAEGMCRFRRAAREDGEQRAQDGIMPKFESVHNAGDGGEDAGGRVAEQEGCCEDAESLREDEEKRQRGEGESQFEEGENVWEGKQVEVGEGGVAQEVGKDGGEEMSREEIEDQGGDIQRIKCGDELKNAVDEAEGENKIHAFARADDGGGDGKKGERKKGQRIEEERRIRFEDECDDHPKGRESELQSERLRDEARSRRAIEFPNEGCVGAEVGEGVAEQDDRGDESELPKVGEAETAGKQGNEQDGKRLRCDAGEEQVDGVAFDARH